MDKINLIIKIEKLIAELDVLDPRYGGAYAIGYLAALRAVLGIIKPL